MTFPRDFGIALSQFNLIRTAGGGTFKFKPRQWVGVWMKLNWAETWVVNNPLRIFEQQMQIKWFKRVMPLKPGMTIMEIGCGRGAGAKLIWRAFRPSLLHALDLDAKMISKAKKYLLSRPTPPVKLYVGDSINLPFKSCAADAVFGFGFLHHVPDWRQALAEIARVLKDGGIYYMEELYPTLYQNVVTRHILVHPEHDRFNSRELKMVMSDKNLRLAKVMELPYVGILGVAKRSDR